MSESNCTAVVRLKLVATSVDEILPKVQAAKAAVEQQDGLIRAQLLVHTDRSEIINVLEWRSRDDHEACQTAPEVMMAGMELLSYIQQGSLEMSVDVYQPADSLG